MILRVHIFFVFLEEMEKTDRGHQIKRFMDKYVEYTPISIGRLCAVPAGGGLST